MVKGRTVRPARHRGCRYRAPVDDVEFPVAPADLPLDVLLGRAARALGLLRHRLAADHGLTPSALAVLVSLDDREAPSGRDLAARLGVSPATLTPVLDALEEAGHVRRVRDERDRRNVRLLITDTGRRRIVAHDEVAAELARLLPEPSAAEARAVRRYLARVLAAADVPG